MANNQIRKVQEVLELEGWSYRKSGNDIIFIASFGPRKWKMNIHCSAAGQICCFAAYPWQVSEKRQGKVLAGLNGMNLRQQRGCFLLSSSFEKVLYRCGVQIIDEYTAYDGIRDILLTSVAIVNDCWMDIYILLFGVDEEPYNRLETEGNNG